MTNSKVKGFLIERDGRSLFMKEVEPWAIEDVNYKVTPLISGLMEDREDFPVKLPDSSETSESQERLELLEQIYELEEQQIAAMKSTLEGAVELIETISEFAAKKTDNVMELKGLMLLIAESCNEWLKPKD